MTPGMVETAMPFSFVWRGEIQIAGMAKVRTAEPVT